MKTALITGITGQDGLHLTELLLGLDYRVVGTCRDSRSLKAARFGLMFPEVKLHTRPTETEKIQQELIEEYSPDEVYNLGALSSVFDSYGDPVGVANETAIWALKLFEACRKSKVASSVKVYQAGSSEMFGIPTESPQSEVTPFHPVSPYGASKAFAHNIAVQYREIYGLDVSNGILYNHEGPYRTPEFVSRKITSSVAQIKAGRIQKFKLGNMEGRRDWGYAGDYVKAMHLMLQSESADDFVISTGKSHSVREFLELTLTKANLEPNIEKYVEFDRALQRPADSKVLVGDYSKAREKLGWSPSTSFEELVELMLHEDMRLIQEDCI
jgi:GDPmannose 4,6-dehydratase